MKKILLQLTEETLTAVDHARGETARNPWIESALKRTKAVREAADELGIELPKSRPDGRGRPKTPCKLPPDAE